MLIFEQTSVSFPDAYVVRTDMHAAWRCDMKDTDLENMSHDALWDLHQKILEVLSRRLEDETRKLQKQLDELGRKSGKTPAEMLKRRPQPKAKPKFRNPDNPSETWSGRGKMPRWLARFVEAGRSRDEFKV